MAIEVAAYVFEGTYTAEDMLRKARAAEELNLIWIDDVAVIKRHHSGRVSIHSTWAQDDSDSGFGVGWGALTGGLIGAMAGPAGVLAGILGGGAMGGFAGAAMDIALDDPQLDALAQSLGKGTSALVLAGETSAFVETFDRMGGKLLRTILDEEKSAALAKAVKDAADAVG